MGFINICNHPFSYSRMIFSLNPNIRIININTFSHRWIRRKGADSFRPALAAGGSLMAYKCLSLCRFRGFTAGFCKNFVQRFQKFKVRFQGKAKNFDLFRIEYSNFG